jgi:putative ABC transport system permease protein
MLTNYLKVALRNLLKHPTFSIINVVGLALGMGCAMLVFLWVQDELSFDRFHEHAGELYRVEQDRFDQDRTVHFRWTPPMAGPAFLEAVPEVGGMARLIDAGTLSLRHGEAAFEEEEALGVDSSFLRLFTFPRCSAWMARKSGRSMSASTRG